jgi:tetratricopeptide (TPR) repeat protein
MSVPARILNRVVAAIVPLILTCAMALAEDQAKLDGLFDRLKTAGAEEAGRIESEIWIEWSKSGSPALDLLLQRGRDAMALGDTTLAIEHFTAIIDQDPGFAEAWNARATAFYQAGEFGPSMSDIAQVLQLNPRHFGALSGLGSILEESGKPETALKAYKAALEIHPQMEGVIAAVGRLETESEGQEL